MCYLGVQGKYEITRKPPQCQTTHPSHYNTTEMINTYNNKICDLNATSFRNKHQVDRAIRARYFIDKYYSEKVDLTSIVIAVHSTKFHLNREFKRLYGTTPVQYLKEKRIQEAKKILTNNGTVSDACYTVGYESLSTFSILFRRMTGKNATAFKSARMKK